MTLGGRARARAVDELDRRLLALLREDGRASIVALGRALDLGHAAVHARVRRLQQLGLVRGFYARLDYARLGLGLSAFVGIQTQQASAARARLAEHLRDMPEVEALAWVTGEYDALVKVRARDTAHLQEVVFRMIQSGAGQMRTRTMVVLSEPFSKPGPEFERVSSQP